MRRGSDRGPIESGDVSSHGTHYVLRLYVAGMTPTCTRAIATVKRTCEEHLVGHYDLRVIELSQEPALAKRDGVVAVPTLIRELPPPVRRIVGDFSDGERFLVELSLKPGPNGKELQP